MTIGIDAGGSALKIALSRDGKMGHGLYENYGGRSTEEMIGTFLDACGAVNSLHVTGVHAKTCGAETFGLPPVYVPEPEAIGRGGTALAGLNEAIVASVGTGTAFVLCRNGEYTHLGGTGIGGGTIL
ncbi:MAG: pantothenate kinase, partial [Firmicutes bacterium]|nr:pantothenate kinase [Bacillota bacterium]